MDTMFYPLLIEHALRVASLPHHHRDPFDRALVAQAQVEGLALLTADRAISHYSLKILW
jgi:PIN domain nuclease of toxin-antitoxin system